MTVTQAIILGIVQGATEFLPVSSSGHLVLVPWWLGWPVPPDLTFSIAAHLGTLCAVLIYFRRDWLRVVHGALKLLKNRNLDDLDSRLFVLLVVGSIPSGIIGALFASEFEKLFQKAIAAAIFLLVTTILLVLSERKRETSRSMDGMDQRDAFIVGLAQLLALFPGISRSGSTIAAGLFRDVNRADAARFSFLLGTPAILGAGVLAGIGLLNGSSLYAQIPALISGFLSAAIVGYLAIAFLLAYIRRHRLYVFAVYCAIVGLVSLLAALLGR